jgi:DNA polymerase-3 subunit epsilon
MRESGQTLDEWMARAYKEIPDFIAQEGNPNGPHYGENIVFTGTLKMLRYEAANMATQAGFYVQKGVTQETTMLVVGIQDKDRLAGYEKSSKHRKAEAMAQSGHSIKIITEDDFLALLD